MAQIGNVIQDGTVGLQGPIIDRTHADRDHDQGTIAENERMAKTDIGKENVSVRGVQDDREALAETHGAGIALAGNAVK